MKIFELTKKHNINFHNFKLHLEKLGYIGYKGPNKVIPENEVESLEKIAAEFVETQAKLDAEKLAKKKGSFIGIVYDDSAGKFKSVVVRVGMKELADKDVEFEVLDEHGAVFGAMLKVQNMMRRYVNDSTVQKFGNAEE